MQEAIDLLLRPGGLDVARKFRLARKFWREFFSAHRSDDATQLAAAIGQAQWAYEALFDHKRALAKETMPFTCFGSLYRTREGWGRRAAFAVRLMKAFQASSVSLEVKVSAWEAAEMYGLEDKDPWIAAQIAKTKHSLLIRHS